MIAYLIFFELTYEFSITRYVCESYTQFLTIYSTSKTDEIANLKSLVYFDWESNRVPLHWQTVYPHKHILLYIFL